MLVYVAMFPSEDRTSSRLSKKYPLSSATINGMISSLKISPSLFHREYFRIRREIFAHLLDYLVSCSFYDFPVIPVSDLFLKAGAPQCTKDSPVATCINYLVQECPLDRKCLFLNMMLILACFAHTKEFSPDLKKVFDFIPEMKEFPFNAMYRLAVDEIEDRELSDLVLYCCRKPGFHHVTVLLDNRELSCSGVDYYILSSAQSRVKPQNNLHICVQNLVMNSQLGYSRKNLGNFHHEFKEAPISGVILHDSNTFAVSSRAETHNLWSEDTSYHLKYLALHANMRLVWE